jgi:hypothetical protein
MSRDTVKFWSLLAVMILAVSCTVLVVDLSIKAAILEESTKLRLAIEAERNDRATEATTARASYNGSDSSSLLDLNAAGMEAANVRETPTRTARTPRTTRSKSVGRRPGAGDSKVPTGD